MIFAQAAAIAGAQGQVDEIREMATGIGRDYFDLMNHLRDARTAITRQGRPWT